ncbi:fam86a protein [Ophiostoma piceae UAMH 11346]|uniref:Fam86a protein n=1 Tax=Ophiostoma piceae (strain UAMH 11346) TaxID=1262450 RepID=S3CPY0_OPHP1|nr:fam86a protein [Ophiostoma piceae UAMH 11346]
MDGNALTQSLPVQRFCRQYLQAEPNPDFPTDRALLRDEHVQEYLYTRLFSPEACAPAKSQMPPAYALRILKKLIAAIEASIDDWDEHAVSDNLLDHFANFSSTSTAPFAVRKHRVVYSVSALSTPPHASSSASASTRSITFLENRATISAGGTTGIRTWEAALHLGEYLCRDQPTLVQGKRVLELGAGTGYVSILCAKHLGAAACVATDGSVEVVHSLPANLELNGLDDKTVASRELAWGPTPPEWAEDAAAPFDVILGADITFDARDMPDLLATIRWCLSANKGATVLISATERNKKTFDTFMQLASEQSLRVATVDFPVIPRHEQAGPFYSDAVPIHICQLSVM